MENIVVHKTLKRAQNEKQQSADNCAGRSYPLTMSFFINFMSFMVKKGFCTGVSKMGVARFAGGESEKRGHVESENHYAQRDSKPSE